MAGEARRRDPDRRQRLLEAAVAAFAARGFHGTSTRDIAAAAGMSPAAIYVHHESKEELLYQISRSGHEAVLDRLRAAIATAEDPAAQLVAAMRAFATHHARAHTVARIVNYELAALSEEHRREISRLRRAITAELRAVVDRGVAAGIFDTPDPRMATTVLLSLGVDISRWYQENHPLTAEQLGEFYADVALRVVGQGRTGRTASAARSGRAPGERR
ncbi:MAG: TetR family transcriptional regulator [Micromonosporaceae bacterium]|nr:TetR family transcriptional regulator [Micromonosporaceae bacterium]